MSVRRSALLLCVALLIISFNFSISAYAHPGRTDSNGGHRNSDTGEYHYHHGYPAHEHYDIDGDGAVDCPYDFDDQTSHSSSISNQIKISQKEENLVKARKVTLSDIIAAMFEYLFVGIAIWLFSSYFLSYILFSVCGEEQGCFVSITSGAAIALVFYIWAVANSLS